MNSIMYEDLEWDSEKRFYPSFVPVIKHEPLKDDFMIVESPEAIKKGIISRVTFEEGELVAQCTGFVLKFQTLHSLQHSKGIYYSDEFFAGYLLHSCDPNCRLDMSDFSLHAIKKIRPLDKVTVDYEATEDYLYNTFDCDCGSANCRGKIEGGKASLLRKVKEPIEVTITKNKVIYNEDKEEQPTK